MKTNLRKNILYQCIYEMLVILTPLITTPIVTRALGPENSGIYSYSYSVANYYVLFCMLGIKNHGSRIIAEKSDNRDELSKTFSSLLVLHVAVSIVVLFAYFVYVSHISSASYRFIALLQGMFVLSALFDINWFYIGIEQFKLTVTRNILIKIITIVFIVLFVRCSQDLWKYVCIMAGGTLISQVWLWGYLKKYVYISGPNMTIIRENIAPLLILFIPAVAVSLYKMMDKIMIGWYSKTELGYYEYAERIIAVPMSIIEAVGVVMLPRITRMMADGDATGSKKTIQLSMKYNMILAVAMAFGIAAISKEFVPIFFGEDYLPCIMLMFGLSITIPFLSFANVLRKQYMIPTKMDRMYNAAVICGAATNLLCNFALIPKYNSKGAMIGTIVAEIVVCSMHIIACRKDLPIRKYLKNVIPFLVIGFIMFALVRIVARISGISTIGLIIEIATGFVFYSFMSFIVLYMQKDKTILEIIERGKRKVTI